MLKKYIFDTHRICSPKETVTHVLKIIKNTWIINDTNLKIYSIGELDIFNEYVYSISSNIWKRNNWWKWLTKYQALASALMEFSERYSWYKIIEKINNQKKNKLININDREVLDIDKLILTNSDKIKKIENINYFDNIYMNYIEWISLITNKKILIPWYEPEFMTTNSLWAWNNKEEATIHAIYETIERHNHNVMMANHVLPLLINDNTITNSNIIKLINKIKLLGFEVYLLDCSFNFNINTIWAIVYNKNFQFVEHYSMNFHLWTHSDKDIAIIRALTEVIQNRATNFDNNKSSIYKEADNMILDENNISKIVKFYLENIRNNNLEIINYKNIINYNFSDLWLELEYILNELKNKWHDVFLIDITNDKLKIPAVRVVIPWLQPMLFELFDDFNNKNIRLSEYIDNGFIT